MMMQDGNKHQKKKIRTKQKPPAPRQVLQSKKTSTVQLGVDKLVWVTVGKTEHQAWLLEDLTEQETVLVRWESTRTDERVPVVAVRYTIPSRRQRQLNARIHHRLDLLSSPNGVTTYSLDHCASSNLHSSYFCFVIARISVSIIIPKATGNWCKAF